MTKQLKSQLLGKQVVKHFKHKSCPRNTGKNEHRKRNKQDVEKENNKEKETERGKDTPDNKEKYKEEDEKISTIKEPDIAKGLMEND